MAKPREGPPSSIVQVVNSMDQAVAFVDEAKSMTMQEVELEGLQ